MTDALARMTLTVKTRTGRAMEKFTRMRKTSRLPGAFVALLVMSCEPDLTFLRVGFQRSTVSNQQGSDISRLHLKNLAN
jgi:hypothetical protein